MNLGIDPKNDFAFKWLFGREQNLSLLIDLLNAILKPPPGKEIVWLELLNPYNEKEREDDKLSIVDVKARDKNGRQFDVEMQVLSEKAFSKRILYYWARLHQQQLDSGVHYEQLQQTVSICFVDFVLFPNVDSYRLPFELRNQEHNIVFSSDMLIMILELPKFRVRPESISNELEAWLYFLCNAEQLDSRHLPQALETPEIRKAFKELIVISQDDLARERYEASLRLQRDEASRLYSALRQGREEGREKVASMILVFLRQTLGDLNDETAARVSSLEFERLEQLMTAIHSFKSEEQLQNWLA